MAKRVRHFFGKELNEADLFDLNQFQIAEHLFDVIERRFLGAGKWNNAPMHRVLLSLTRKRPRDLIKLCHASAKEAYRNRRDIITTEDLRARLIPLSPLAPDVVFRFDRPAMFA